MQEKLNQALGKLKQDTETHKEMDTSLRTLERDVWKKIAARRLEYPIKWHEHLLAILFSNKYRFAPIAAVLVLGVLSGGMTLVTLQNRATHVSASEMLNFKVFKPKLISLTYAKLHKDRL